MFMPDEMMCFAPLCHGMFMDIAFVSACAFAFVLSCCVVLWCVVLRRDGLHCVVLHGVVLLCL